MTESKKAKRVKRQNYGPLDHPWKTADLDPNDFKEWGMGEM